jgi:undecaprenyl-diphosphatase
MNEVDLLLLRKINQEWTNALLDWLMPAVSAIDAWVPLLVLAGLWIAWKGGARGRWMLGILLITLAVNDGLVCKSLKSAVGRPRPRDAMDGVMIRDLGKADFGMARLFKPVVIKPGKRQDPLLPGKSFPSSHTANLFAAAVVIAAFHRGFGLLAFGLAFLVAWSRVYCGAHWPMDIPPSAAIGMLVALACLGLAKRCFATHRREEMGGAAGA